MDSEELPLTSRRLRQARIEAKFDTAADAARRFGWKPSTYSSHENGQTNPPRSRVAMYARAFKKSQAWLLGEDAGGEKPEPEVRAVPVVGEAAAGTWLEHDRLFEDDVPHVPAVPDRFPSLRQFAYRVRGPSMDKERLFDGDYAICVDFWEARRRPQQKDIVIVERKRGQLVERTCKQIDIVGGVVLLAPRSSDPRFQEPIRWTDGKGDGEDVEIVGLVIGRYAPISI